VASVTPRPRFTSGERTPGTHCTRGLVDLRAGLDAEATGKILCLCPGSNPVRPVCSQTGVQNHKDRIGTLVKPSDGYNFLLMRTLYFLSKMLGSPQHV
jgi:hypothetical protein